MTMTFGTKNGEKIPFGASSSYVKHWTMKKSKKRFNLTGMLLFCQKFFDGSNFSKVVPSSRITSQNV